jgi:hypothetical protein
MSKFSKLQSNHYKSLAALEGNKIQTLIQCNENILLNVNHLTTRLAVKALKFFAIFIWLIPSLLKFSE